MKEKTIHELKQEGTEGVFIMDVRTPAEYASKHIPGAVNIPLGTIDCSKVKELSNGRSIITVCASGGRSKKACEQLMSEDIQNASSLIGGTKAWVDAGYPCNGSGKEIISIERQVRIIAGALVLLGVVLGYAIAPGFLILSGFVGAGLIFAGITDFCGMAMVLGKMPWNTKSSKFCSTTKKENT